MLLPIVFLLGSSPAIKKRAPKSHVVEIVQMKFKPALVVIQPGDTVTWINKDILAHDVTENSNTWASGSMAAGASWSKVFNETSDYFCSVHVVMKGKVLVR